ncbi:hypothetical protein LEMLEM_LOCUS25021 [Lemmus lemmus]
MDTGQRPSAICFNCQALNTGKNCLSSKLKISRQWTGLLESTA